MRLTLLFLIGISSVFPGCFELETQPQFDISQGGLHYLFHQQNDAEKPLVGDEVLYNMTIRSGESTLNATQRKQIIPLVAKKNPILQALKMMSLGDSMTIAIFVDSLPRKPANFDDGDTMLVDIKVVDIRRKEEIDRDLAEMKNKADRVNENIRDHIQNYIDGKLAYEETASGLRYVIEEQGTGKSADLGNRVSLHFAGFLPSGEEFESTFRSGIPKAFYFDESKTKAVPGFKEGLQLLHEGSRATLIIPNELAYGKKGMGPIPPKSDLIIYVELIEVE